MKPTELAKLLRILAQICVKGRPIKVRLHRCNGNYYQLRVKSSKVEKFLTVFGGKIKTYCQNGDSGFDCWMVSAEDWFDKHLGPIFIAFGWNISEEPKMNRNEDRWIEYKITRS